MRSKTLEDDIISWPESRGEEMETLKRIDKGKGREEVEERKWKKSVITSSPKWILRSEEMKWKG